MGKMGKKDEKDTPNKQDRNRKSAKLAKRERSALLKRIGKLEAQVLELGQLPCDSDTVATAADMAMPPTSTRSVLNIGASPCVLPGGFLCAMPGIRLHEG